MALDRDTVRRIAVLARIRVPEADLDALAADLSKIIGWVEQLGEVDTKGVAPMTSVAHMPPAARPDVVDDGACPERILANAPESRDGFFIVPKVVE